MIKENKPKILNSVQNNQNKTFIPDHDVLKNRWIFFSLNPSPVFEIVYVPGQTGTWVNGTQASVALVHQEFL